MPATAMKQTPRGTAAQPRTRISNILVPIDFEDPARHALEYAEQIAGQFGASLTLMHVVIPPYVLPVADGGFYQLTPEVMDGVVKDAEKRLASALAGVGAPPRSHTIVRTGDPRAEIVNFAAAEGIDLIVMGTRGRTGAEHLIFGSVAEHVVRTAPCPVLTVR